MAVADEEVAKIVCLEDNIDRKGRRFVHNNLFRNIGVRGISSWMSAYTPTVEEQRIVVHYLLHLCILYHIIN